MDGHIKLFRKFLDWGWYQDINTKVLFIHMLLKANWKDGNSWAQRFRVVPLYRLSRTLHMRQGLQNGRLGPEFPT